MEDELLECAFKQQAKRSNCVGYCNNHHCYLTITHLKNMKCLQKQCKYLERIINHKFWINRAKRKEKNRG